MRMLVPFIIAISSPVFAQESHPLIGNWKLVAYQLTREGRMAAVLTSDTRKAAKTDPERAELFKSMLAYSGKYRVEGMEFITTVDVSWNEAWNGTEQRRHYRLEGDKLFIESAPQPSTLFPNRTIVGRLVWERER